MDKLIELGGRGLLIPAVLAVLVLYAARGLFGWHGRRSQHRKEFLELWDLARSQDELWLEIAVRHWLGTYLPAHIIRLAMSQPDKTQSLIELSELWELIRYDRDTRTAGWLHRRHRTIQKRKAVRVLLIAAYFVSAITALLIAWAASMLGPSLFSGWAYGTGALMLGVLAVICLMRDDTMKVAVSVGEEWLVRINRSAPPLAIDHVSGGQKIGSDSVERK